MLYRILRAMNRWFVPAVIGFYVSSLFVGLCFLFIFPQITLGLFFLCLLSLAVTIPLSQLFGAMEHWRARKAMRSGMCPNCAAPIAHGIPHDDYWTCGTCQKRFTQNGTEIDRAQLAAEG